MYQHIKKRMVYLYFFSRAHGRKCLPCALSAGHVSPNLFLFGRVDETDWNVIKQHSRLISKSSKNIPFISFFRKLSSSRLSQYLARQFILKEVYGSAFYTVLFK